MYYKKNFINLLLISINCCRHVKKRNLRAWALANIDKVRKLHLKYRQRFNKRYLSRASFPVKTAVAPNEMFVEIRFGPVDEKNKFAVAHYISARRSMFLFLLLDSSRFPTEGSTRMFNEFARRGPGIKNRASPLSSRLWIYAFIARAR